jgi:hypothetical protein
LKSPTIRPRFLIIAIGVLAIGLGIWFNGRRDPLPSELAAMPGVATIETHLLPSPASKGWVIHLVDYHFVPEALFALDVRQEAGRAREVGAAGILASEICLNACRWTMTTLWRRAIPGSRKSGMPPFCRNKRSSGTTKAAANHLPSIEFLLQRCRDFPNLYSSLAQHFLAPNFVKYRFEIGAISQRGKVGIGFQLTQFAGIQKIAFVGDSVQIPDGLPGPSLALFL